MPVSEILVIGGDNLAVSVCEELSAYEAQHVTLLWHSAADRLARRVTDCGARFVRGESTDRDVLVAAGVLGAKSIIVLSDDDHLNLETSLKALDINPDVRIVMRISNRSLGQKIESNLPNCSVISLAAQSAATYASAAVDPQCFYGIQFPDFTGALFGFAERSVRDCKAVDMSVERAEDFLNVRIIALDGTIVSDRSASLRNSKTFVSFGLVRPETLKNRRFRDLRSDVLALVPRLLRRISRTVARSDLVARSVVGSALALSAAATTYFSRSLHIDALSAAYLVLTTMTTMGYDEFVPRPGQHAQMVASMLTIGAGVVFTAIFVAVLASRFTEAQWTLRQGLRRVLRRGHIVVCGAGNVGVSIVELLRRLNKHVVVIDVDPTSVIVDRARDREFDLLTGDASADATLALCNLQEADALIAVTRSDTVNLDIVLGAGKIDPRLRVVCRVKEQPFARSISKHFGLSGTFGSAGLAALVFSGLSQVAGARGFVTIGGQEFGIVDDRAEPVEPALKDHPVVAERIPLVVRRDGVTALVSSFSDVHADEHVLTLYPAYKFRKQKSE